jgi:hypothetical protein
MEIGLEHFAHIDYNLARAVLQQSIASQTSRHQKNLDATDIALVAEAHAENVTPLPPRRDVHYTSSNRKPKTGTED